ncbi:MAG: ABC transporter ATP-binding protein [Candidatus Methylumidiphilus sp.]
MPTSAKDRLLDVQKLSCGYGDRCVITMLDLIADCGELIALIGHNGAGKSTLLRAINADNSVRISEGAVYYKGISNDDATPRTLRKRGIAYCAQGGRVFQDLTAIENLQLGAESVRRLEATSLLKMEAERWFPALSTAWASLASELSGGQQQMLSISMALASRPSLLLLDEPTLGLSPRLVAELLAKIQAIATTGVAVMIVEHRVREVLAVADRAYVLRAGRVSFEGTSLALQDDNLLKKVYL